MKIENKIRWARYGGGLLSWIMAGLLVISHNSINLKNPLANDLMIILFLFFELILMTLGFVLIVRCETFIENKEYLEK